VGEAYCRVERGASQWVQDLPLPWMITQQSSFELCFAISSPVSFTACVSLLSWFIVANGVRPSCVDVVSRCSITVLYDPRIYLL
jgi:hypothetical protein